jgi:uncharacterized protein involved in exopolysaccharide biosynthesis/Mrp family chromosome partitioning ATPase
VSPSRKTYPADDDIDLATLGAALWRAKGWILGLVIGAGLVTFVGLSMMRPLYTSEARILIQNEDSVFTRPTGEQGRSEPRSSLDEQAVQSQVQVLTSRDLILQVVKDLDLVNNEAFAKDAGETLLGRLTKRMGLGRGSPESQEERAANALAGHLDVFQLSKSSVIAVEYTSGDPALAAEIANKLADVYIGWQRTAKIEQTKDATVWLDDQIKALRKATAESEEAVETFKASEGLYAGSNNVTLNEQQLSELNSQLILAGAQESEARARAKLIKQMLADNGDIDATPEVLKSQLIINLIEQRVTVQRQLAELSATLLPSHPRIQQLRSELADVRAQIRDEAQKVVRSLENEAQVAAAREASLRESLNTAKSTSAGLGDSEIKLRALEREAKANRDLLESYLARYRDASARHDMGAVPSQAVIVSRAHASVLPSFPKRGPLTLLVMAATALLALAYTLARELIGTASPRSRREPRATRPKQRTSHEPPKPVPTPVTTPVDAPAPTTRPAAATKPAAVQPAAPRPAAEVPAARKLPVVRPAMTGPAAAPPPAEAKAGATPKPEQQDGIDTTTKPSVWRAQKPAKRPSWLQVNEPRRVRPAPESEAPRQEPPQASKDAPVKAERVAATDSERVATAEASPAARSPSGETQSRPKPAATGLLDRLRQEFTEEVEEAGLREKSNAPKRLGGLLDRFRRTATEQTTKWKPRASSSKPKGGNMAALSPNDLRHYLTQRIAASEADQPAEIPSKPKSGAGSSGPVLKSLDAVLDKVLDAATGGLPRALLVAGTSSGADATKAAIGLARALADRNEQVVLVDLAKGASAVSGPLGMPRVPGFADLSAGRADFGDVIRVDDETPLQVIAAGNPAVQGEEPEPDRFMRVFEALTQAYGCVVLHADLAAIEVLMPALKFELPIMVAVLPPRGNVGSEDEALATFQALGCPVVVYEGSGRLRRSGLFSRSAAV